MVEDLADFCSRSTFGRLDGNSFCISFENRKVLICCVHVDDILLSYNDNLLTAEQADFIAHTIVRFVFTRSPFPHEFVCMEY